MSVVRNTLTALAECKGEKMKIKKGLDVHTAELWYDLTDGGGLNPDEICELESDAIRVKEAIVVLKDFAESCVDQIEDFYI